MADALGPVARGGSASPPADGPSSKRQRTGGQETPPAASADRLDPPLSLMRVRNIPSWGGEGFLGAQLPDLVRGEMLLLLVSNFMLDFQWLVSACPDIVRAQRLVIVHGEKGERAADIRRQAFQLGLGPRATIHKPNLPEYGTYHSKAFLVQYAGGLRVVVFTANAIYSDCNNKSESLWAQDFPLKTQAGASQGSSVFEEDLVEYVDALRLEPPAVSVAMRAMIRLHDFSAARARLVASVPGRHKGPMINRFGHMKLRRCLAAERFPSAFAAAPVVAQYSSVGSLNEAWLLGTGNPGAYEFSFLKSLSAGRHAGGELGPPPRNGTGVKLVWPTVEEVKSSVEGWFAGGSVPGKAQNVNRPFLQQHYHRWGGEAAGRERAMPHIKTFLRYQGQEVQYLLATSHNLSKAAWGAHELRGSQLHIRSFELGALLLPSLEAAYLRSPWRGFDASGERPTLGPLAGVGQDARVRFVAWQRGKPQGPSVEGDVVTVPLPVPFTLPPARYSEGDTPWAADTEWPGVDAYGRTKNSPYGAYYGLVESMEWGLF